MASKLAKSAITKIAQGTLQGKIVNKRNTTFYSFQGIPYAKPPLGPLRFKSPQPPENWNGTRDAFKEGPSSAQLGFVVKTKFYGEEDCLYLNVYTPKLPENSEELKIPVMVFIHGGGFSSGSGNSNVYGPDYLVSEVVLVTINYRLGALGFLSLPDASVPGNNGLKDQVAALHWIKQNIASFGGDPNNITIFGQSSGGASVNYHVLSAMSKGLFHKAIAQSGCVLNPWAVSTHEQAQGRAQRLGKTLGSKFTDQKDLFQFLQTVSARDIVEASAKMLTKEEKMAFTLSLFLPVPETGDSSDEVFLSDYPLNLLKEGKFSHVPYMTGITSSEGMWHVADLLEHPEHIKLVDKSFQYQLPSEIHNKKNSKEIITFVKKYYFGDKQFDESCFQGQIDFFTHTWFLNGIHQTINFLLAKSPQPVYFYFFDFDGKLNYAKKFVKAESLQGASHMDDLGYLFHMDALNVELQPQCPSCKVMRRMVKLWTNFAKTGNPTPILDSDINVAWPAITQTSSKYYRINEDLSVDENLMIKDINFWQKIVQN